MFKNNIKTISGIFVFTLSLLTYLLTIEPSNSFWDCSEFITCAYNLEVGHAPGAPVFMLLGRFFSLFASSPSSIALMVNSLSALSSALTVMLLFFIIYWFAERIQNHTSNTKINYKALAAAMIGALIYAFTDSFWFSAVEAEVYATSSLFTALVFWFILKYAETENSTRAYQWLILIFFVLGLSVGIHLLNLLTLPAMALVVYFKHYKVTKKGIVLALLLSAGLLLVFIAGIIPGVAQMAAFTDRIFVNNLALPVYSGALFFISALAGFLYLGFRYYSRKGNILKQAIVLCLTFWLIGYSSFAILVIRSAQNPFVDINNVENLYGLVDYLNREQYPSRPLLYGNAYNSPIVEVHKRYTYKLYDGKYYKDELNPNYSFDKNTLTLFPRMASMDENHVKAYNQWLDIKGKPVKVTDRNGQGNTIKVPTLKENIHFFFKYQLGYMYLRYFMWNFAGKQNDIQGHGDALNGNWLSGISFIDNFRLGNQDNLPDYYKNHQARNIYFMLPLILGFIGMVFQYRRDKKNFFVNLLLFFFTGIAIVLYLNEVPVTPRERDYVHVGSFFVFAIWMGLGALGILEKVSTYTGVKGIKLKTTSRQYAWLIHAGISILLFGIPTLLLLQNWDDHNRSNRFTAHDFGTNMLNSCEKNAILFTTADNDTYPLWYLQEVEKCRPDIRNILLTFLPVDWYADQLHQDFDGKGNIPISYKGKELLMDANQYFPVMSRIDSFIELGQVIDFVKSSDEKTQLKASDNSMLNFIPGKNLELKVNAENLKKSCTYLSGADIHIPATIKFTVNKSYLGRDDLLILDILAKNNWERPIYFVYPHLLEELGLAEYLHREGLVYRFLPFKTSDIGDFGWEQSMYQYNMIKDKFAWGNVNSPEVFLDYTNVQMVQSFRFRLMFIELANQLSFCNEKNKAVEILDLAQRLFPPERVPYSWFMPEMVKAYLNAGNNEKAKGLADKIEGEMQQRYEFSQQLNSKWKTEFTNQETLYIMQQLASIYEY